jgi:thiopurine S-methyltransferase
MHGSQRSFFNLMSLFVMFTKTSSFMKLSMMGKPMSRRLIGIPLFVAAATTSFTLLQAQAESAEPVCHAEGSKKSSSSNDNTDRLKPWKDRWESGNTRWHKSEVHPMLQKYLDEKILDAFPAGGARIFVPLCGKTVDMQYMATKRKVAQVVGVDGVPKAIEEFAENYPELNVQPVGTSPHGPFEQWKGESITLVQGDFFDVNEQVLGGACDAVWDRGSMVAIDPSLRDQYVQTLGKVLVKPGGRILLSALVHSKGTGPPFSLEESDVRRLYEGQPWVESVELLESHSALAQEPWYKAVFLFFRLGNMQEKIFLITTKAEEQIAQQES